MDSILTSQKENAGGHNPAFMVPRAFLIRKQSKETHDVVSLQLNPSSELEEFHFCAGQFNMVYVFGVGEVPISISSDPADPSQLIHTIRNVGEVTRALCGLKKGDWVGIRGPFGSSWPVKEACGKDILIIIGGIGLAPLRPAIYQILRERSQFDKVAILYGARSPRDILFGRELKKWGERLDLQLRLTVDHADGEWHGSVGVVTTLIDKVRFNPANTLAMLCGPEIMMRFTVEKLKDGGLSSQDIYVSMERNMKCAVGLCGHCQYGAQFICKDGPVFRFDKIEGLFNIREI